MNILDFFLKANFFVQLTIIILFSLSILSWGIIIQRIIVIRFIVNQNKNFEVYFKEQKNIIEFYKKFNFNSTKLIGLKKVFFTIINKFIFLTSNNIYKTNMLFKLIFKFMVIVIERELFLIKKNIFFLGIIGSISPYIGLFGTIFGVINTLLSFSSMKYLNIQIIAPGIAEALIVTIIGLFVAIPAITAFNILNYKINLIERYYNIFIDELFIALYNNINSSNKEIYSYNNEEK